jgi:tRNA modification GTPase
MSGTIVAIASPPGTGAVSLVRVSGERALEIAAKAVGGPGLPEARRAALRRLRDKEGRVIDEGVMVVFPGPGSYTGEDVVEFTGHGGVVVTRQVLERFIELGARPAGPGEFTQRAFLNGRMDLTQAEAVMDLISARTSLALRSATEQLEGRLGRTCEDIRAALLGATAHLEAYIDFPEEDIDPAVGEALAAKLRGQKGAIEQLLATADQGRILREGVRTVIYGKPNVGKSSLLNRLLGYRRAIVSDREGTTRDTIEEVINLRGIPLRLIDTAGVRESDDDLEREGIAMTRGQLERALGSLVGGGEPELTALDLREALAAVGEIAGVVDTEEILGEIFGNFCIGK